MHVDLFIKIPKCGISHGMHGGGSVGFFSWERREKRGSGAVFASLRPVVMRHFKGFSRSHAPSSTCEDVYDHETLWSSREVLFSRSILRLSGAQITCWENHTFDARLEVPLFLAINAFSVTVFFKESCTNRKKRLNSKQTRVGGEFVLPGVPSCVTVTGF